MAGLFEDLEKYAHEAYTKNDAQAGLKLLAELAGAASRYATGAALSTLTIPFLGPTITRDLVIGLTHKAMEAYSNLSSEERRYVRAAVRFVSPAGIINEILGGAGEMDLMVDIADIAGDLEEISDKLQDLWEAARRKN
jgi:hypothetical protein